MSGLSLAFDTPQLAQQYEVRSAERQFVNGQRLVAALGVRAGERVLDIGSGTGLLAEHVAGLVGPTGKVLGIDPLPLRIEIAQRKAKENLSFQVGNAYALDGLPSGSFDVVYLNAVFHWLPEKTEPLKQIHRLLKPGGRLGITTGAKDQPNLLQRIKREVLSRAPYAAYPESLAGTPHWVTADELSALLGGAGFTVQKIETQQNVHHQPDGNAAIAFSQASSFGNFLGHLPESLRSQAIDDIKRELEAFRTPEGIRLEGKRLLAVAHKPASH
ncbi:fibrillarin-like rRNA methylase [Sorangium cellulosum]|uniref:Fibrillarin-like rRNA methylase n=1 Tax=Sorangium cellulosum TaxID=56 RepID=A0A2L0ES43_SORCE|nr:methyltransferase domain-containing protein [Sorangium cellulosum]AUX42121.1 fibrillarin-like rRNA methylase [Sorangium cellulosum]